MDGPSASPEAAVNLPDAPSPWRRRLLVWVLPLLVGVLAVWYYGSAGRYVETDNAYVHRDRVDVAPQVSGDVVQVMVAPTAGAFSTLPAWVASELQRGASAKSNAKAPRVVNQQTDARSFSTQAA